MSTRYIAVDLPSARRLSVLVLLVIVVLELAFLPVALPSRMPGALGWAAAGTLVGGAALLALAFVRHPSRPGPGGLLALSYLGALQVAVLELLGGGHRTPYAEMYLVWLLYAAAIHPPRRFAVFFVAVAALSLAPATYEGWDAAAATQAAARILLWGGLSVLAALLMSKLRAQRQELRELGQQAELLARIDPLTGLGNRRAFNESLKVEVARARRRGGPLALLTIDLANFKAVNDQFGHVVGDLTLQRTAASIRDTVRGGDLCFRWGGDEFALILPDTDRAAAGLLASRIGDAVRRRAERPDSLGQEIACGISELDDRVGPDEMLTRADLALIAGKR